MSKQLNQLDRWLEGVFKDVPGLPADWKKGLVKALPWLVLLGGVMGLMGIFGALSMGGMLIGMAGVFGYHWGWQYWLNLVLLVVMTGLDFKAYKPLKEKKAEGWKLSWYMTLAFLAEAVVGFNVGSLVGAILSFYLLYQVKSEYK